MRDADAAGLIDYYVLTERDSGYHGHGSAALANYLLPPNVYHEVFGERHAKIAVMNLSAFSHRMRRDSWDTTLWTRFSQPTRLVSFDSMYREAVVDAIVMGWRTAAFWADALVVDRRENPSARWTTLFTQTYGVELRPEGGRDRASRIVEANSDLFAQIDAALLTEPPSLSDAKSIIRRWRWRKAVGKPLNVMRLLKAAFTFRGGVDYAMSKLDRHTAGGSFLKPWERRHPWLAAPGVLFRLLRSRGRS